MAQDLLGLHHQHKRKRKPQKLGEYPHPKKSYRFLDKFVLFGGLLGPIVTIPQIIKIWVEKSAINLSLISWIGYLFGALVLLTYSFVHKEKPLVLIYGAIVIVDLMVLISILIYGQGLL